MSVSRAAYLGGAGGRRRPRGRLAAPSRLAAARGARRDRRRGAGRRRGLRAVGDEGALVSVSAPARLARRGRPSTQSDAKRMDLWNEALSATADRPVAGLGAGAFVVADRLYRPAERRAMTPWALASDPHSLPLLVASDHRAGRPGPRGRDHRPRAVLAGASPAREARRGRAEGRWRARRRAADDAAVRAGTRSRRSPTSRRRRVPARQPARQGRRLPRGPCRRGAPRAAGKDGLVAHGPGIARGAGGLVVGTGAGGDRPVGRGDERRRRPLLARRQGVRRRGARRRPVAVRARRRPLHVGAVLQPRGRRQLWRQGSPTTTAALVDRGSALLDRGIERDPTGPLGYADLARLAIAQGDPRGGGRAGASRPGVEPRPPRASGLVGLRRARRPEPARRTRRSGRGSPASSRTCPRRRPTGGTG